MEKTAMQELIDDLKNSIFNELDVIEHPNLYHNNDVIQAINIVNSTEYAIRKATKLLPKERQQIIEAGNKCQIVSDVMADGEIRFLYRNGENYFTNTFNQ